MAAWSEAFLTPLVGRMAELLGERTLPWVLALGAILAGWAVFALLAGPFRSVPAALAALLTGLVIVLFGTALLGRPDPER